MKLGTDGIIHLPNQSPSLVIPIFLIFIQFFRQILLSFFDIHIGPDGNVLIMS